MSEAYWVGALSMAMAIAHRRLLAGDYAGAEDVIERTLKRYMESSQCEPRYRKRLARNARLREAGYV